MKIPMITPKKNESPKHQRVSGGFLQPGLWSVLLVCFLVFLPSYSKASDTETSSQLLKNKGFEANTNSTNPTYWTNDGDGYVCNTCGPAGGNALKTAKEGATVTSDGVNLLDTMTQDELNNGFEATYGSDVWLYSNNSSVPSCTGVQGQDCKDTFSITLDIKDSSGTLLKQFEHRYENQSWTGWDRTTYDFTSTIPANDWTSAIASLELYGIDEGYTGNGYGGPRFDNTHLTVTYTTQAVLDSITTAINQTLDLVNEQTEIATDIVQNFEVTVNDPIGNEIQTFSVEVAPATDTNLTPEISIAPIEVPQAQSMESEVEVASIETEMNNAQGDMSQQSTEESGTDSQVESQSESSEPKERAQGSSTVREKQSTKSEGNKSKPKNMKKAKRDAKQKVANKIVKNMGDKGRYDNTNQLRTLVVMGVLGNTRSFFSAQKIIPDTPNFFQPTSIPDSRISDNTGAAYYMIGGSDVAHRALVDTQYK